MFLDPKKHVLQGFKDPCLFRDFSKRDMNASILFKVNYKQKGKVLLVQLLLKFRKLFLEILIQHYVGVNTLNRAKRPTV